jgi:hypothetical protein
VNHCQRKNLLLFISFERISEQFRHILDLLYIQEVFVIKLDRCLSALAGLFLAYPIPQVHTVS